MIGIIQTGKAWLFITMIHYSSMKKCQTNHFINTLHRYVQNDCGNEPSGYVPMIKKWDGEDELPDIPDKYTTILGFNEPYNHGEDPLTIALAWLDVSL